MQAHDVAEIAAELLQAEKREFEESQAQFQSEFEAREARFNAELETIAPQKNKGLNETAARWLLASRQKMLGLAVSRRIISPSVA
jgi:hypothetical protein